MSWIIGNTSDGIREPLRHCPEHPAVIIERKGGVICAGGNARTLRWGKLASGDDYVVLGAPALVKDGRYLPLTDEILRETLLSEERLRKLDGHFLACIIGPEGIRAYNDPLGKRSLYIWHQGGATWFTSSLPLLKDLLRPELDWRALGAYWHAMFPPSNDRYAPTDRSYYKDVQVLGTGGKAVLGESTQLESQLFEPAQDKQDIYTLLRSFCLLPASHPGKIAISLSGGMDIRPLLAIYLRAGVQISAIHYGNDDSCDFRVARQICAEFHIPFRHISYEAAEGADPWAQTLEFKRRWGIAAPPANAPYLGYYQDVASECATYVSGYFGELFRFRFFVAHLASVFKGKRIQAADLSAYLYRIPARIFLPEVARQLHEGYRESIRQAFARMPAPGTMSNPHWFNLFLARYSPFTVNMPSLAELDALLVDHMPWLQSAVIGQHWHLGLGFQLAEGVHRTLVRREFPALERFPLALADVQAPYHYRQYMLKLKMWRYYRRRPLTRESRADRFLELHRQQIRDLLVSRRVQEFGAYDHAALSRSLNAYYRGDKAQRDTLMSWLAIELGR